MSKEGKKKPILKRWWFWAAVIIVIIIIVANMGGGGGSNTVTTTAKADPAKQTNQTNKGKSDKKPAKKDETKKVGVGEPAKIADVTFTIDKAKETTEIKPNSDILQPAKAGDGSKFIVLHVTIKNGQKDALNILSDYFKLKTSDGTTYSPSTDSKVIMAIPTDQQIFLKQINPGITKDGTIVYQVPKSLKLSDLFVHCQTGFWGTQTVDIQLGK